MNNDMTTAKSSKRLGTEGRAYVERVHDLDKVEAYDGVWANACLLHVPRPELAQVLARIWRALKPGGTFYASFKTGAAEGRDRFNRYYNYPSPDWLRTNYAGAGNWSSLETETAKSGASTMNGPRCCSWWPAKASDHRVPREP